MKNLVILHLESVSRHRLAMFEAAFPNTLRLMRDAVVFDNFFSSATSTLMVVTYLCHGNDFEFDAASVFEGMVPAGNTRNLFSILRDRGYETELISLDTAAALRPIELSAWPADLPPVWATNDVQALLARFDRLTDAPAFAVYVWDLITHIEHSVALAAVSSGLTDQLFRACTLADQIIGKMLGILKRKGLLENTTIVVYGDHGDDFWTHGFKSGMVHATEPYTDITWTPMAIYDATLPPGRNANLASTIDIAPTCLALLGAGEPVSFPHAGTDLLQRAPDCVYSQNLTATQRAYPGSGITKAFSATGRNHNLVVSSHGLELYAYRLDPGNHCNLLNLFDLEADGRLVLRIPREVSKHFRGALQDNPRGVDSLARDFAQLRAALMARVDAKRAYALARGFQSDDVVDPRCFDTISESGRAAFLRSFR